MIRDQATALDRRCLRFNNWCMTAYNIGDVMIGLKTGFKLGPIHIVGVT